MVVYLLNACGRGIAATPTVFRAVDSPIVPPVARTKLTPTSHFSKKSRAATSQPKLGDTAFASLRSASHPKLKITIRGNVETLARYLRTRVEPVSNASTRDEFLLLNYQARVRAHITMLRCLPKRSGSFDRAEEF